MADEQSKNRWRNSQRPGSRAARNSLSTGEQRARLSLHPRTRRRFRMACRHPAAMMLPTTAAAGGKLRIRIRPKHCLADQRDAENNQQQCCEQTMHALILLPSPKLFKQLGNNR